MQTENTKPSAKMIRQSIIAARSAVASACAEEERCISARKVKVTDDITLGVDDGDRLYIHLEKVGGKSLLDGDAKKLRDALVALYPLEMAVAPMTANGVPVTECCEMYLVHPEVIQPMRFTSCVLDLHNKQAFVVYQRADYLVAVHCYSTYEDAEAAILAKGAKS